MIVRIAGPFGVATVTVRHTRDPVRVSEHSITVGRGQVDDLRAARAQAGQARKLLARAAGTGVPVRAAVVFVGSRRFTVDRGGPADVAVLPRLRALHGWLRGQQAILGPAEVSEVYELAGQPATWQPAGSQPR